MTAAHPAADDVAPAERGGALDALRIVVVVGLVFFHSALVFDSRDDFYVKNAQTADLSILAAVGVVWAMPLLFLVAGTAAWHSLRRRGPAGFAVERLRRLLVPLVFATVTIIPLPQWLRLRAADPGSDESYPRFLRRFFEVRLDLGDFPFVLQGRYFETGHLWFVLLLLTFSFLLLPAFAWLLTDRGRRALRRWITAGTRPGVILAGAVPTALISAALGLEEGLAAWSRWAYLVFFAYGFLLAADERLRTAVRSHGPVAAALGVALFLLSAVAFLVVAGDGADPLTARGLVPVAGRLAYGAAGWCWLVAILGLLDRRRRPRAPGATAVEPTDRSGGQPPGRWYPYLREAVLPLYVLHQPVVVVVASWVVGLQAGILPKYAVLVSASLVLTLAVYDLLVRRTAVTRFLFGMRPRTSLPPQNRTRT